MPFEYVERLALFDGEPNLELEALAEPVDPEPAHGGRSARCERVGCVLPFAGALWPKPCGALPRSVALPCASQARAPVAERFCDAPLVVEFNVARLLNAPFADGGLFCESWFWREDNPELTRALLVAAEFPVVSAADSPVVLIVCTGMCEAAAPGAVRAITERFCIDDGGAETCPLRFAAPNELCLFGAREL